MTELKYTLSQEEEERLGCDKRNEIPVMSVEAYSRRVEAGQRRLLLRYDRRERELAEGLRNNEDCWSTSSELDEERVEREEEEAKLQQEVRDSARVLEIACGEMHTVALLSNGLVVACGSGENGQLGIGHDIDMNFPVSVPAMSERAGVRLVCSSSSTFAYLPVTVSPVAREEGGDSKTGGENSRRDT